MSITYADFIEKFPAFSSLTEAEVTRQLNFSSRLLDSSAWNDFYQDAVYLDTAHTLSIRTLANNGGTGGGQQAGVGQITSASVAGMSTSFAQLNTGEGNYTVDWYSKTSYGQEFLRLQSIIIPAGVMAI